MIFHAALTAIFVIAIRAASLVGVNIPGCKLAFDHNGFTQPKTVADSNYLACPIDDSVAHMGRLALQDGVNVFRLPVTWQSLVKGDLQKNRLYEAWLRTNYYPLVQACLDTGAYCIIDMHSHARWDGRIVGQEDGPPASSLARTWAQIARRYSNQNRIIFGTMHEPYSSIDSKGETLGDLDVALWAATLQQVVYAIRDAGAESQIILVSGTNRANALSFPVDSGTALQAVHNRDGSLGNIIFEFHQDLVIPSNSSKRGACDTTIASKLKTTGDYLRFIRRQAFVGELGVGDAQHCDRAACQVLETLDEYEDVFLGWAIQPDNPALLSHESSEIGWREYDISRLLKTCSGSDAVEITREQVVMS